MNMAYPKPISILDLANIVSETFNEQTNGKIHPEISIVDKGIPESGNPNDKDSLELDVSKIKNILKLDMKNNYFFLLRKINDEKIVSKTLASEPLEVSKNVSILQKKSKIPVSKKYKI